MKRTFDKETAQAVKQIIKGFRIKSSDTKRRADSSKRLADARLALKEMKNLNF